MNCNSLFIYQNSPSAIFLTANRSLSITGTSSHSRPPLAQAPTYSPPGPRGFLNFTNCTASPPNVSTYTASRSIYNFLNSFSNIFIVSMIYANEEYEVVVNILTLSIAYNL